MAFDLAAFILGAVAGGVCGWLASQLSVGESLSMLQDEVAKAARRVSSLTEILEKKSEKVHAGVIIQKPPSTGSADSNNTSTMTASILELKRFLEGLQREIRNFYMKDRK